MVMTHSTLGGSNHFEDDDAPQTSGAPAHWEVTEHDVFVERADLGPGVSTFYRAGSAIPPELAKLPRQLAPRAPETPESAGSDRRTAERMERR